MKFQDVLVGNRFTYCEDWFVRVNPHDDDAARSVVNAYLVDEPSVKFLFENNTDVNMTLFRDLALGDRFVYRGVTLERVKLHERKVFGFVNAREPNPSPKCKDGSWAFLDDRDMVEVA